MLPSYTFLINFKFLSSSQKILTNSVNMKERKKYSWKVCNEWNDGISSKWSGNHWLSFNLRFRLDIHLSNLKCTFGKNCPLIKIELSEKSYPLIQLKMHYSKKAVHLSNQKCSFWDLNKSCPLIQPKIQFLKFERELGQNEFFFQNEFMGQNEFLGQNKFFDQNEFGRCI